MSKMAKADEVVTVEESSSTVHSIKGFDKKLSCRGFQFEIGKTYEVSGENIKACKNGFHACPVDEHPLSVFAFYPPAGSRYAEVTQGGKSDRQDTKLASASIVIGVEISINELIARAVRWVFDRSKPEGEAATGYQGAASATGKHSAALASGYNGRARASQGSAIVLVYRDPDTGAIVHIRSSKVGENSIKPDTFYSLNSKGDFVEADHV